MSKLCTGLGLIFFVCCFGTNTVGLGSMNPPYAKNLRLLASPDPFERVKGIRALGEMKEKGEVSSLVILLVNDDVPAVRGWAAWALSEMGDPLAIDPLIIALELSEKRVQQGGVVYRERYCIASFNRALEKLTGGSFTTYEHWKAWREKNKGQEKK